MSMNYSLTTISEENIIKVENDPAFICLFIEPEMYLDFTETESEEIPEVTLEQGEDKKLNIGWSAQFAGMMHFCLSEKRVLKNTPIDFLLGGSFDTNIEMGWSTIRVVSPLDLKKALNALENLSDNCISTNFDSNELINLKFLPEDYDPTSNEDYISNLNSGLNNLINELKQCLNSNFGVYIELI